MAVRRCYDGEFENLYNPKKCGEKMLECLAVGIGGFIGSCLRYFFTKFFNYFSLSFPFGTLLSNVIAALVFGIIIGLEQHLMVFSPKTRLFLTTGILGGLSTFSTFSVETITFFQKKQYLLASGNILLNLGLSLLFVCIGIFLINQILRQAV